MYPSKIYKFCIVCRCLSDFVIKFVNVLIINGIKILLFKIYYIILTLLTNFITQLLLRPLYNPKLIFVRRLMNQPGAETKKKFTIDSSCNHCHDKGYKCINCWTRITQMTLLKGKTLFWNLLITCTTRQILIFS